jgi:ankyrin repeat protein
MTKFNSENPDPRNRFKPEEQGLNLDDMLNFIEEIKKHGFNATNPKAQEILKKFPYKLQEYLIEIEKIKKDKEKENPNETLAEKEKRKKENSERSNKIAQELFIIACASEMPLDKALQFHENCGFGVKELSQFGENGLSPLSAMMLSDKSPEEMQKVIDKGADINEKSPSGMTVTDLAVLVGNEKMVETLEQKGGKLNLVSKEIGRETEAEEEREKGREKSREREQEKQQRQIQKKQETAQREQAARELKQQMAEERIQQQQIARQMQMVIVREAMEVHEGVVQNY